MFVNDIKTTEYAPFYANYISKAGHLSLIAGLEQGKNQTLTFFEALPTEKWEYRYAKNKWTIKDVLQHIIDTELIFVYRALRVARADKTPLPGFEQDDYVTHAHANNKTFQQLLTEYNLLRQFTISLFNGFTSQMLLQMGEASGSAISVRALGFILIGHEQHHIDVIKARYL
ncbi:DinB family protein [Bizionia sediminis]|uniref:DinB family protein n=1 Tax=Bizionia sediminis TaxID=1737064 RepID=A0ABW5KR55_9FLAO